MLTGVTNLSALSVYGIMESWGIQILEVALDHGSRDVACLGQFAVRSVPKRSASLATVPPLISVVRCNRVLESGPTEHR